MTENQITLVKQYVKAGLELSIHIGGFNPITKVTYENKSWWAKTISGDFRLWDIPSSKLYIKAGGKYQKSLFDGTGKTLVRQGPIDTITAPYYQYMVSKFNDIRPGSMVILDTAATKVLARVINRGTYLDILNPILSQTIPLVDLTGLNKGASGDCPEDLIIDVVSIKLRVTLHPNLLVAYIYLVPFNKLSELGFIITELI